ncbi:MAG: RidA family protein [Planctomycetes bacterium]|nr:RidA family protein [Planctomycetota bacterium]
MELPDSPQARIAALDLVLPPIGKPAGAYKPCLVVGTQALVSGHLPFRADGTLLKGRVGEDLDADGGKEAARLAGLAILATLVDHLGSLDRVARVVKLMGLVSCPAGFTQHPHVFNGCSELFAAVWGPDHGVGVRSAFGVASLPLGVPVEIEAVFELA